MLYKLHITKNRVQSLRQKQEDAVNEWKTNRTTFEKLKEYLDPIEDESIVKRNCRNNL